MVLYVWVMAELWERALTNPWVGLTQRTALSSSALFLPTSWSLAGSPSLQQGYGACRVSGGAVMVKVRVTVPGMGFGGQGGSQTHVWQMRAGCPFLY